MAAFMIPNIGVTSSGLEALTGSTRHVDETEAKLLRRGLPPLLRSGTVAFSMTPGEMNIDEIMTLHKHCDQRGETKKLRAIRGAL